MFHCFPGPGSCHGDSGGPVFSSSSSGGPVLLGVTSSGTSRIGNCGGVDNPTHYARVKRLLPWIRNYVEDACISGEEEIKAGKAGEESAEVRIGKEERVVGKRRERKRKRHRSGIVPFIL